MPLLAPDRYLDLEALRTKYPCPFVREAAGRLRINGYFTLGSWLAAQTPDQLAELCTLCERALADDDAALARALVLVLVLAQAEALAVPDVSAACELLKTLLAHTALVRLARDGVLTVALARFSLEHPEPARLQLTDAGFDSLTARARQ